MSTERAIQVELSESAARALLAAEPFKGKDNTDWIKGRDALMNALHEQAPFPTSKAA